MYERYVTEWLEIGLNTKPIDFEAAKKAVQAILDYVGADAPIRYAPSPKGLKVSNTLFGQCWSAGWCANVNALHNEHGWNGDTLPIFRLEEAVAKTCFLVCWEDDLVTIIDRPEVIKQDDQKLLHCEDGPAIRFRDGWSVYSWHGNRVPKKWIEDAPTIDDALHYKDVELRRCAAEIIGWNTILDRLDGRTIDKNGNPLVGEVIEVDIPDIGTERFLRVMCGTNREFALPIPPDIGDAVSAQRWLNQEDELPAFRT